MNERNFLVLLIVAGLAIKVPLAMMTTSFGVDESLYLSTARNFVDTGVFGLDSNGYDFRFINPLWPAAASAFYWLSGEKGVLFLSALLSSLTIPVFYYLGKKVFDERAGRIAAVIGLASPAMLVLATRPLTESMALFFFSFAVLAMYLALKGKGSRMMLFAFPVLFMLTFLSRFQYGGVLLILFAAYAMVTRSYGNLLRPHLAYGILVAVLLSSSWLMLNVQNYGNPLGGAEHQAGTDLGFVLSTAALYLPYTLVVVGSVIPFVLYGLYVCVKRRDALPVLGFVLIVAVQMAVFGKVSEERYLLPLVPFAVLLAYAGFADLRKKWPRLATYAMVGLLLANFAVGYYGVSYYQTYARYGDTKDAVLFAKDNCSSPIMSNSFTQVWYYSGYDNVPLSAAPSDVQSVKTAGGNCIIVSGWEAPFKDDVAGSGLATKIFGKGELAVYRIN